MFLCGHFQFIIYKIKSMSATTRGALWCFSRECHGSVLAQARPSVKKRKPYKESCLVNHSSSSLHRATHFVGLLNLLLKATKPLRATQGHDSTSKILFAHWFTSALPLDSWLEGSLCVTHCLRSVEGKPDVCVCVPVCTVNCNCLSKAACFLQLLLVFWVTVNQSFHWGIISVVELGKACCVVYGTDTGSSWTELFQAFHIATWCRGTARENTSFYLLS